MSDEMLNLESIFWQVWLCDKDDNKLKQVFYA